MPDGGLIAGYNCGSSINAELLLGYRVRIWGIYKGYKIEFSINTRNKEEQVVATETSNKRCVAQF